MTWRSDIKLAPTHAWCTHYSSIIEVGMEAVEGIEDQQLSNELIDQFHAIKNQVGGGVNGQSEKDQEKDWSIDTTLLNIRLKQGWIRVEATG